MKPLVVHSAHLVAPCGEPLPLLDDDLEGFDWPPDGTRSVSWSFPLQEVHPDLLAFLLCQLEHQHDMATCVPFSFVLGDA